MLLRSPNSHAISYSYGTTFATLARANFPTTTELNSWYHPSGMSHEGIDAQDPTVCLNVTGVTDEQLVSMAPIRGGTTYRPGSTYVRTLDGGRTYAVGTHRELHLIHFERRDDDLIPSSWLPERLVRLVPEYLLNEYVISPRVRTEQGNFPTYLQV